jgi:hypothetical protein
MATNFVDYQFNEVVEKPQASRFAYKTIEVSDPLTNKLFLEVPKQLYKNDKNWVCPIDSQIEDAFNPVRNSYFRKGEAKRWVLVDEKRKLTGRIAAFYNTDKALTNNLQPTGGIGFFECANNKAAAFQLFDLAKEWLAAKGMQAMDGPINIGENFMNWGLQVKGFAQPGFGMNYNFPYYQELFEEYGFRLYFRQYSFHLDLNQPFPERFWKIADWVARKPHFRFEHFTFKNQDKYIQDICDIYNEAWSDFKKDYVPLNFRDVKDAFEPAKAIADEKMIWLAYFQDRPIAFFIMFPDVNQIFKHFNGKMNLRNIIKYLVLKKMGTITRIRSVIAGVVPKFQNSGIESAILSKYRDVILKQWNYRHYKEIELSWVGDFNPRMQSFYIKTGAQWAKTHYTYRYLFDPEMPFDRFMPNEVHLLGEGRD